MEEEIEKLRNEIANLENEILFLAALFARRDAAQQAQIVGLEAANLQLAQQVAWFRGTVEGGSSGFRGSSEVQ